MYEGHPLTITYPSSSSAASLISESLPGPNVDYSIDTPLEEEPSQPSLDPAAELAQRVRLSSGVMLAVSTDAQLQIIGIHIPGARHISA